jgi:hypothetical protein
LGAALPALLPGVRVGTATLNGKAIMGRARLPCAADIASAADPLAVIAPFVKIEITTDRKTRAGLSSITNVLRQYLPAGVRYSLRWRLQSISASDDEAALVLDGHHAGVLGSDSLIGNTTLAGSGVARIHVDGLDMGFTL